MSIYTLQHNLNVWRSRVGLFLLLASALLVSSGCNFLLPKEVVPADITREGISLPEAQNLVGFPICLPSHIPPGISPIPRITYHADFGDPMDSDLRLRYYRFDNQELVAEIYQMQWPGSSSLDDSENSKEVARRELLAWVVGWPKVDENREHVTINVMIDRDGNREFRLSEIIEPTSLYANTIESTDSTVYYRLYSRLPVEQTKEIARSIGCSIRSAIMPTE